jgi:hypothetical protein
VALTTQTPEAWASGGGEEWKNSLILWGRGGPFFYSGVVVDFQERFVEFVGQVGERIQNAGIFEIRFYFCFSIFVKRFVVCVDQFAPFLSFWLRDISPATRLWGFWESHLAILGSMKNFEDAQKQITWYISNILESTGKSVTTQ